MNQLKKVDLASFDNSKLDTGASKWKYLLWYFVSSFIVQSPLFPISKLRVALLRMFGAQVGENVIISKPGVNVKFPWKLVIGDNTWIGENAWIYNLDQVNIGSDVCISQGAMLLTGNHNYKSVKFETFTKPITIEDGCFIGARSVICPGVSCKKYAVLSVGAIATKDLESEGIYFGNPAKLVKKRFD